MALLFQSLIPIGRDCKSCPPESKRRCDTCPEETRLLMKAYYSQQESVSEKNMIFGLLGLKTPPVLYDKGGKI